MKDSILLKYKSFGVFLIALVTIVTPLVVADELSEGNDESQEFIFDDSLLFGGGYGENYLARFNTVEKILPGRYQIDIYLNNERLNRQIIKFVAEDSKRVFPCLDVSFWRETNIISTFIDETLIENGQCVLPESVVRGVSTKFDSEQLRLDIAIPQAYLQQTPRGFVDPNSWDAGDTAGFISYNSNFYQTTSRGNGSDMRAFYTGLNTGVNWGLWRLKNQSSYHYNEVNQDSQDSFNSIRTYAIRALPDTQSELLLGEGYTRGNVFGSLSFTGIQLQTDNRMLPDSLRGYAPVVRGLANTTAKVVIKQNGVSIYQTTVAAGPFAISDLYPTSYEGDLLVEITEADGSISSFNVPFSAVPGSLREGQSQYAYSLGEVSHYGSGGYLADLTYEHGLSNALTLNTSGRIGKDYFALSIGTVLGTEWGAFGFTTVHSSSRIAKYTEYDEWKNGWRVGVNYSQSFDSGTAVTLAGYHYSTESYLELSDVLGLRAMLSNQDKFVSATYLQQAEMSISLNQSLDDLGYIYISGSKRQYRDGRADDDQIQLGYSVSFGSINLGLNFSRQYTSEFATQNSFADLQIGKVDTYDSNRQKEDLWSLTFSMPFGSTQSNTLNTGISRSSREMNNYNLGLSGAVTDDKTWVYGLSAAKSSANNSLSINTQKRFNQAALTGSLSIADEYQQVSTGISGAVVAHSGGITLSQNLSETFAIIEAEGAKGAKVTNSWGTEIDSAGYAIVPSLTPYRINKVTLDTGDMLSSTELLNTQQQVAPYTGAIVKMKFDTRYGIAVLFMTSLTDASVIPIGAEVKDLDGHIIGLVGQAGMAYVRAPQANGQLTINWGNKVGQQCRFDYDLSINDKSLQRFPVKCILIN